MRPILFEIRDAVGKLRHVEIFDLFGPVAYSHLVEHDPKGPHVDGRRDPRFFFHLWRLVVLRTDAELHESRFFRGVNHVAEAEVADLCHRTLLIICGVYLLMIHDEDVV